MRMHRVVSLCVKGRQPFLVLGGMANTGVFQFKTDNTPFYTVHPVHVRKRICLLLSTCKYVP